MKRTLTITVTLILLIALAIPVRTSSWTQAQENKDLAHTIAEMMRAEGHPEDHPVILACQEWWRSEHEASQYAPEYTTKEQRAQYPVACAVWQLLRESGMDEVHAAALIGNAMAESGGHTLDLNLYQYVDGFYGMWAMSTVYFPDVYGTGVPGQVEALLNSLDSNMRVAGGSEKEFLEITDVRQAAKYFSDKWERPAVWNSNRADNAEFALSYFGG